MDSIPLEMDNIFDDYDDVDDMGPRRLPDMEDMDTELQPMMDRQEDDQNASDGNEDATDNPELLAKLNAMKGASKHTAKRTMPKLDATRLIGERGIAVLPKVFKDVPLKGKNHEVEDLKVIMHHLEHWGHRLFPKMPFSEVLERVERLGSKKEVQTCVKRVRLGMPVLMSDTVEDDDEVQRVGGGADSDGGDGDAVVNQVVNSNLNGPDEDEIERMIREHEELERQSSQTEERWSSSGTATQTQPSSQEDHRTASQVLSDEVKARIEKNKRIAMEKRAARLGQGLPSQEPASQTATPSSPQSQDILGPNTGTTPNPHLASSSPQREDEGNEDEEFEEFESALEILECGEDVEPKNSQPQPSNDVTEDDSEAPLVIHEEDSN